MTRVVGRAVLTIAIAFTLLTATPTGANILLGIVPAVTGTTKPNSNGILSVDTVHRECLIRWESSHQPHTLNRWKKLEHCLEIEVKDPIQIDGLVDSYVDSCWDDAVNSNGFREALVVAASLGADILGGGGTATVTAIGVIIDRTVDEFLDCLTDVDEISDYLKNRIEEEIDARVRERSKWVYWNVF